MLSAKRKLPLAELDRRVRPRKGKDDSDIELDESDFGSRESDAASDSEEYDDEDEDQDESEDEEESGVRYNQDYHDTRL